MVTKVRTYYSFSTCWTSTVQYIWNLGTTPRNHHKTFVTPQSLSKFVPSVYWSKLNIFVGRTTISSYLTTSLPGYLLVSNLPTSTATDPDSHPYFNFSSEPHPNFYPSLLLSLFHNPNDDTKTEPTTTTVSNSIPHHLPLLKTSFPLIMISNYFHQLVSRLCDWKRTVVFVVMED